MKVYFDESGQTGCVLLNKEMLNFKQQPIFSLGAVIVKDETDENEMLKKYREFKNKFNILGEIKGSELTTRERNEELLYFIDKILDSEHFAVNIYDKRFYLSTLLLFSLIGNVFRDEFPVHFYEISSQLAFEEDNFFVEYCKFVQKPSKETFHEYLLFLVNFKYKYIKEECNLIIQMAKTILEKSAEGDFYEDFMTFGWYDDSKVSNLINLNALSELISFVKIGNNRSNSKTVYVHDKIKQFETTLKKELGKFEITIDFPNSDEPELLQLADNIASVFGHAFVKMKSLFAAKKEWDGESEWDMKLLSKLLSKIGHNNIKFTVPIADWAAALCIENMYSESFPKQYRKNIFFNPLYEKTCNEIAMNICLLQPLQFKIDEILKR